MKLHLVDSTYELFRAYFALPPTMTAPDGRGVHAVYGFADTLVRLLAQVRLSAHTEGLEA